MTANYQSWDSFSLKRRKGAAAMLQLSRYNWIACWLLAVPCANSTKSIVHELSLYGKNDFCRCVKGDAAALHAVAQSSIVMHNSSQRARFDTALNCSESML